MRGVLSAGEYLAGLASGAVLVMLWLGFAALIVGAVAAILLQTIFLLRLGIGAMRLIYGAYLLNAFIRHFASRSD